MAASRDSGSTGWGRSRRRRSQAPLATGLLAGLLVLSSLGLAAGQAVAQVHGCGCRQHVTELSCEL